MNYLDKAGLTYLWGKIKTLLSNKQDKLVSGTNIKTVNGESLIGSGNISISGDSGSSEKSIVTAHISGTQTVTASASSYGKVALDSYVSCGSKLTFNTSTNQIRIGAGVSKILISAQIRFNNAWNSGVVGSAIYKNGEIASITMNYKANATSALGIINAPRLIDVAENDLIDLRYYTSVAISAKTLGTANGTYLTVEVVE